MSATLALDLALLAAAPAPAAPPVTTVCHDADQDKDVSLTAGLDGFRPGETFTREFIRVGADHIIDAPQYFERFSFKGTTPDLTYEIKLDDPRDKTPKSPDDWVNNRSGYYRKGAMGTIHPIGDSGGLEIDAGCNTLNSPSGTCRINLTNLPRPGTTLGPGLAFMTNGDRVSDLCITGVGFGNADIGVWTLTLDGAQQPPLPDRCTGLELASKTAAAGEVIVTLSYPTNNNAVAVTVLNADQIKTALDYAAYIRALAYDPASPRHQYMADRIADSKAAFAAAGDNLPPCPGSAPITRPAPAPKPNP